MNPRVALEAYMIDLCLAGKHELADKVRRSMYELDDLVLWAREVSRIQVAKPNDMGRWKQKQLRLILEKFGDSP